MQARQTVTMIGWLWVGLGALALMSGTMGFLMSFSMADMTLPRGMDEFSANFLFKHYRTGALVQICLAFFAVISGYYLTRRCNWARVAIQAFSLLNILWLVLFCIAWVRTLGYITSAPEGPPAGVAFVIRWGMSVAGVAMNAGFAALFGSCIWLLSREKVREECRRMNQTGQG